MSKTRIEYGHVTFPLSLTKEEREQYAEFCKSKDQTMSGRIKELMRQDMGFNVLSPYTEKYQLDIINGIKTNKKTLLIKSRQMWVSTILLSVMLDRMLNDNVYKEPYKCIFFSHSREAANVHHKKFLQICYDNGIKIEGDWDKKIVLPNYASIQFVHSLQPGIGAHLLVLDEAAFWKMDSQKLRETMMHSSRVVLSSTPFRGSAFNAMAMEALKKKEKSDFKVIVAHWTMNSVHMNKAVVVPRFSDSKITFDIMQEDIRCMMSNDDMYAQEMGCALLD